MPTLSTQSRTPCAPPPPSTPKHVALARTAGVIVALAGVAALATSCSLVVETTSKQCSHDADCTKLGAAFADSVCQKNLCVAPTAVPVDPLDCQAVDAGAAGGSVKFTFNIAFAATPDNAHPFTILACDRLDVTCDHPVFGPTLANSGDLVELDLASGFHGYLQITNPDTVSAMEFLDKPLLEDTRGWDLTIATETTVALLGALANTPLDRTLGTVVVIGRDCDRAALSGLVLANSLGGTGFYFNDMVPDRSLMATTGEGAGGFVNVPIGETVVSAVSSAGHVFSPNSGVSRAGWFSYLELLP